jgi:hypothetical protein
VLSTGTYVPDGVDNTKPGNSMLDERINEARDKHFDHKLGHDEHVEVVGSDKV